MQLAIQLHCTHALTSYRMVGDFCGVQIFMDFMRSAYLRKITELGTSRKFKPTKSSEQPKTMKD